LIQKWRFDTGRFHLQRISVTSSNSPIKFSPFHAILQDGIDRLLELIPNEEFTFIVKNEQLKMTLSEAVLISPIISERLKIAPMNREFNFENDNLEMKQFSAFVDFIHRKEVCNVSEEDEIEFLTICKFLGNEKLSLFILNSVGSEISVDNCASKFNSYSINKLRKLSKRTLHSLLSSPSLKIESEDSLLRKLIDLGSEYFEFWCYVEIPFLSKQGVSQFVKRFPFDELSLSHWKTIVDRLNGVCDETFRLHRCRKELDAGWSVPQKSVPKSSGWPVSRPMEWPPDRSLVKPATGWGQEGARPTEEWPSEYLLD
jgi:hypothetical protein